MIQMLGGSKDSAEIVQESLGKVIAELSISDNALSFKFADGTSMTLSDQGQSCCESRYLTFDGDLQQYVGAKLEGAEFKDEYSGQADYEEHEIQPVQISTSKGNFVVEHHNEHNGYYGGFWIVASR